MKNKFPIFMFVAVQVSSVAVLTLWIVWYAVSRVKLGELSDKYGIEPGFQTSVIWLLQGIFLMLPVIAGATIIFIYWRKTRSLERMRSDLISGVSHELLTPIASLRLYIETMMIRSVDQEKKEEFLRLMVEDVERLSSKISNLLVASRVENQKVIYRFDKTDLGAFIHNFIEKNPVMIGAADLTLDIEADCYADIDEDSFNTVLKNLFENAIRYSHERARIRIMLERQGTKLLLSVQDEGRGLAQKDIKKVFNMFYQAGKKRGGTGLGLYIVRNVVRAHRGKVWARPNRSGDGLTMHVLLPAFEKEGD